MNKNLIEEINTLKKERNAVILAHYYTRPEVQDIADFVGDSLALAQQAAKTTADVILFAGVHFMAETAKILSPDKIVLIPDPEAGCSLADSCSAKEFKEFKMLYPNHLVISYVNTSAEIKALTDICCTSSNALRIVENIPVDQPIIFAPDRNLGGYIKSITGRENMVLWDGACSVHEEFSIEKILDLKKKHTNAKIVAHPECRAYILEVADFIGSTAAILDYCKDSDSDEFIVVTESGILHKLQLQSPSKRFIPAPPLDSTCGCNDCAYMKLVTLNKIRNSLLTLSPQVHVDSQIAKDAIRSIEAMLEA